MNAIYKWLLIVHVSYFTLERIAHFEFRVPLFRAVLATFLDRFCRSRFACNFALISWLHRKRMNRQSNVCVVYTIVWLQWVAAHSITRLLVFVVAVIDFVVQDFSYVFFSICSCVCLNLDFHWDVVRLSFVYSIVIVVVNTLFVYRIDDDNTKHDSKMQHRTKKRIYRPIRFIYYPQFNVQYQHNFHFMLRIKCMCNRSTYTISIIQIKSG